MSAKEEDGSNSEPEEALLYSSRHGELRVVNDILLAKTQGSLNVDVSCKGTHKSNLGWTPLHLATYFGHVEVVEALLTGGADINAVNDVGDTALHKASFIGNEGLVVVLLKYGADVQIMNGEGKLAKDVSKSQDIYRLLAATEQAELRDRENRLLKASREGNLDLVNKLLADPQAPSINCVDAQGNTCLHCVAYRGQVHVAAILLQNGIDPTIRNFSGQLAIDLAKDKQMREVLSVRPVRQLQRTAARFEGALLKRSRFLGWRHVWAVLQRGVLVYYGNRAEAASTNNFTRGRRDKKYLDGAKLTTPNNEPALIIVQFSDGDSHKLAIPPLSDRNIDIAAVRQSWITAFNEHIAYSGHYLWVGVGKAKEATEDDDEDDTKPLGSMQDALTNAANSLALFENQLKECTAIVKALENTSNVVSPLHQSAIMRFQHAGASGSRTLIALRHGCALAAQAREQATAVAKREAERARVLEDALTALARQHHELEMSVAEEFHSKRSKRNKKSTSQSNIKTGDEFQGYDQDSDSDTLVTAGFDSPLGALSPWNHSLEATPTGSPDLTPTNSPRMKRAADPTSPTSLKDQEFISSEESMYTAVVSPASSLGTLVSYGGHVYRNARDDAIYRARTSLPVAQFSRGDFSLWSVLKNCVGKELSKITMPVVFNEPLSFLQRMLEYLEYAHLLRLASEQEDPIARMEYIAGFAVSALASNWERLGKPFNPLLGETYELCRPEFRAVCEQVSHHPPVSAFHADSPHFVFHGSVHPKLKFCGKSVEIQPKGQVTVELPKWGEAYTWSNVNCCVHNVIVGRLWIEQYGNMEVVCHGGAGLKANLTFKPAGWHSRDLHRVEGFIVDKNYKNTLMRQFKFNSKKRQKFLYGKWTECIRCCSLSAYETWARENQISTDGEAEHTPKKVLAKLNSFKVGAFRSMSIQEPDDESDGEVPRSDPAYNIDIPESTTLWEATPRPSNTGQYYQFTTFAMSLNELEPGMSGANICPTDSRLRPDVRKLETGDIDGAAAEKTRLEEKQRISRKGSKKANHTWQPRWFTSGTNPYTKQEDWLYSGGYWDRNYAHLKDVDIF